MRDVLSSANDDFRMRVENEKIISQIVGVVEVCDQNGGRVS